jgi:hypothetical protein
MVEEPFPDEDDFTEVELQQPEAPAVRYNLLTGLGLLIALASAGLYYSLYVGITELPETLPSVARLTTVTGDVGVKRRGETVWTQGYEGTQLQLDDQVRTSSSSAAEIAFSNGNVVQVRPSSIVLIGDLAQTPLGEAGMSAWHVEMGQVSFEVAQGTEIVTANARALAASNSSGAIDAAAGGTGIRIFRGSALVTPQEGEALTLNANEGVQVSPEGKAGPKLALPEAPTLLAPENRAEILAQAQGASARLTWEMVERGVTYHVAVDYNVADAGLLLAAGLDQDGIEGDFRELGSLTAGSYFWRVAGRNEAGMEGAYSKVNRFVVLAPPEEEEEILVLFVDLLDVVGDVVHLRGRTGPGASVTVDGHPVNVSSDGRFSEFFKSGRPEVVIRATGADGEIAEERRAVRAPTG